MSQKKDGAQRGRRWFVLSRLGVWVPVGGVYVVLLFQGCEDKLGRHWCCEGGGCGVDEVT